jgi:hypothetical protein
LIREYKILASCTSTPENKMRADNYGLALLMTMRALMGSERTRAWLVRNGFEEAFRNRQRTMFQKKWSRTWARMLEVAISAIDAARETHIPDFPIPEPPRRSPRRGRPSRIHSDGLEVAEAK